MKDNKNIDQLFKERFENFEVTPPPHVWENIQSKLQGKKKETRVIPLWWKVGGVAALLALLLTVGNAVFNPFGNRISTEIVDEDINAQKEKIDTETEKTIQSKTEATIIASENDPQVKSVKDEIKATEKSPTIQHNKTLKKITPIIIASEEDKKAPSNAKNNIRFKDPKNVTSYKKEAIGIASETKKENQKSTIESSKNKIDPRIKKEISPIKEATAVTTTEIKTEKISEVKETSETNLIKETVAITKTETTPEVSKKKSIFEEIEATEAAIANSEKKSTLDKRWEVTPHVAPVYYSSLGDGSSIDASFADNSQSGDINFSYGVKVSYHINDRLSIRSGVSNVDLSYATGGIELATGPVSQALRSINYNGSTNVTTAVDIGSIAENNNPNNPFDNLTPKSASGNVELIQNLSYYEVPMELSYSLVNNRVGINVLGGFSTLFLGNNEVSVVADNLNETLGEANNLSSLSFSTNIGLGFDYKLSKKFKFNIEPMFKYQLNPYTDSSVDFKPYYVGVYTGFSFTF